MESKLTTLSTRINGDLEFPEIYLHLFELISERVEELHLFFYDRDLVSSLINEYPHLFSSLNKLTRLEIFTSHTRLTFDQPDALVKSLGSCSNLVVLSLVMENVMACETLLKRPFEYINEDCSDLDISCLSHISEHIPRLRELTISVVACDRINLPPTNKLLPWDDLEKITFVASLLNRRRRGFNFQETCRFVSLLLPIHGGTTIRMETLNPADFKKTYSQFIHDYNEFAGLFVEQVKSNLEVRIAEKNRLLQKLGVL